MSCVFFPLLFPHFVTFSSPFCFSLFSSFPALLHHCEYSLNFPWLVHSFLYLCNCELQFKQYFSFRIHYLQFFRPKELFHCFIPLRLGQNGNCGKRQHIVKSFMRNKNCNQSLESALIRTMHSGRTLSQRQSDLTL